MAQFHFFTDVDRIDKSSMTVDGKSQLHLPFGPLLEDETDELDSEYNVSSIHFAKTPSGNDSNARPSAYAVCSGSVIFRSVRQQQSSNWIDSGLVDIILKPSVQSEVNPRIKYFVYRSVLLSSIGTKTSASGVTPVEWKFANSNSSALNSQWVAATFPSTNPNPYPLPLIGSSTGLKDIFDKDADDTSYLDDLFGGSLSFSVQAGDEIGRFPNHNEDTPTGGNEATFRMFGFEILLDNYGFHPTLGDVGTRRGYTGNTSIVGHTAAWWKAHVIQFETNGLAHNLSDFSSKPRLKFKHETAKEEVLNYMDPAAYFGNFASPSVNERDTLTLHRKNNFIAAEAGLTSDSHTLAIPNNNTIGLSQKRLITKFLFRAEEGATERIFKNWNKVYLDVRDQYGNSYNYFHKFGKPSTTVSSTAATLEDLRISFNTTPTVKKEVSTRPLYLTAHGQRAFPIAELESIFDNDEFDHSTAMPETSDLNCMLEFKIHDSEIRKYDENDILVPPSVVSKYDIYADCGINVKAVTSDGTLRTGLGINANSKFLQLKVHSTTEYTNPIQFKINHIVEEDKEVLIAQYVRLYVLRHETQIGATPPLTPSEEVSSANPYYTTQNFPYNMPELKNYEYLDNLWMPFGRKERIDQDVNISGIFSTLNSRYFNNLQADGNDYFADLGEAVDNADGHFRTLFVNARNSRDMNFRSTGTPRSSTPSTSISQVPNDLEIFSIWKDDGSVSALGGGNLYKELDEKVNPPRPTRKFLEISSITDNLNSSDPGKSQIVNAARQFSTIYSVTTTRPLPNQLSSFTTGFAGITLSRAQWFQLWDIYNYHFTTSSTGDGTALLPGFKTYLGFVHDGVFTDDSNREYVRFKVVIRGYKEDVTANRIYLQQFDSTPSVGPVYHYIFYPSYDATTNGKILRQSAATKLGSCHEIQERGVISYYQATQKVIHSNLLFARGINMSWKDLVDMKKYVIKNIETVWSTESNVGTWEIFNTNHINEKEAGVAPTLPNIETDMDPYTFHVAAEIKVDLAAPSDYHHIAPGQALVSVIKTLNQNRRSYSLTRKTACFFCIYPSNKTNEVSRTEDDLYEVLFSTAAHEFGHLIGLLDRYCARARVSLSTGNRIVHDSGTNLNGLAVYIPENVDSHYHNKYRWVFNLMFDHMGRGLMADGVDNVAYFKDQNGAHEPKYKNEYDAYEDFVDGDPSVRKALFITPYQWDFVETYTAEPSYGGAYLFLKAVGNSTADTSNAFLGSFAGWRGITDNGVDLSSTATYDDNDLVGEDHFAAAPGTSVPKMADRIDPNTLYWGWIFLSNSITLDSIDPNDLSTGGLDTLNYLISERVLPEGEYDLRLPSSSIWGNEDIFDITDSNLSPVDFGPKVQSSTGPKSTYVDGTHPIQDRGADVWDEAYPANQSITARKFHRHPNRKTIASILAQS